MDEYSCVKKSSLKFKGEKRKKKSEGSGGTRNQLTDVDSTNETVARDQRSEDAETHGGWWKVEKFEQLQDEVAIEFLPGCYAKAMSNGTIVIGSSHPPGEGPDEEEIFTVVTASSNQFALKSGFGKYLSVDTRSRLMGLSDAIGEKEAFLPVFEDGKLAISAHNDCFLSANENIEIQQIMARATKAGPYEMVTMRVNNPLQHTEKLDKTVSDEFGTVYQAELGHLKKYQSHGERSFLRNEDKETLKKARIDGQLYEALLDKRVKHKSDKYCK